MKYLRGRVLAYAHWRMDFHTRNWLSEPYGHRKNIADVECSLLYFIDLGLLRPSDKFAKTFFTLCYEYDFLSEAWNKTTEGGE